MGTDRFNEHRTTCPCGKGLITIDRLEEHPSPTSIPKSRHEARIECQACMTAYSVVRRGFDYVVVLTAELRELDERVAAKFRLGDALMAHPIAVAAVEKLVRLMDSQPPEVTFRMFEPEMEVYDVQSFCRSWRGGQDWVRAHMFAERLRLVLRLVKMPVGELSEMLDAFEAARASMDKPVSSIGPPIFTVARSS